MFNPHHTIFSMANASIYGLYLILDKALSDREFREQNPKMAEELRVIWKFLIDNWISKYY